MSKHTKGPDGPTAGNASSGPRAASRGRGLGPWVAGGLALLVSWILFKALPNSPLSGAGGAIFPVLVVITLLYFSAAWLGPLLDETIFERAHARWLRAERQARPFLRELAQHRESAKKKLSPESLAVLDTAADRLELALQGSSEDELDAALRHAEVVLAEQLGKHRKSMFRDFVEGIGGALVIALALRMFVVEAFKIPSGSMITTLAIGDHIFVNKFIYGLSIPFTNPPRKLFAWSQPQPGEVVVFIAPPPADNAGEDFIKRVIAVAGQKVQLKDGVLFVDDKPYVRTGGESLQYRELTGYSSVAVDRYARHYMEDVNGHLHDVLYEPHGQHDWPTYNPGLNGLDCTDDACTVKPGWVFCMGDNRDNSADSRKWGAVPLENVKGRAMFIWLSVDDTEKNFLGLSRIRWERLGMGIQ